MEKLEQLKKSITNRSESAHEPRVIYLDLNDLESLPRTAEIALQQYGHIDVLLNNAGLSHRSSIAETSMDVHKQLMTVNYFGALLLTKCRYQFGHIETIRFGRWSGWYFHIVLSRRKL